MQLFAVTIHVYFVVNKKTHQRDGGWGVGGVGEACDKSYQRPPSSCTKEYGQYSPSCCDSLLYHNLTQDSISFPVQNTHLTSSFLSSQTWAKLIVYLWNSNFLVPWIFLVPFPVFPFFGWQEIYHPPSISLMTTTTFFWWQLPPGRHWACWLPALGFTGRGVRVNSENSNQQKSSSSSFF